MTDEKINMAGMTVMVLDKSTIANNIFNDLEYENWGKYQGMLRQIIGFNFDYTCPLSGKKLINGELHHALLARSDTIHKGIHSVYNCLMLDHDAHHVITLKESLWYLIDMYGETAIYSYLRDMQHKGVSLPHTLRMLLDSNKLSE